MALTRIVVEKAMAGQGRLREVLLSMGRSVIADGTNPDLNEPMAAALESFGILPLDRSNVTDADLAKLDDSITPAYLDLVEIRMLEILANSLAAKPRSKRYEDYQIDYTDQLRYLSEMIDKKLAQYELRYASSSVPAAVQMPRVICGALRFHDDDCCQI